MNSNTVIGGYAGSGTLRNQFPTQSVATATETALVVNTDASTTTALVTVPVGGVVYGASAPWDVNANAASLRRSGREYGLPSGESNDQFVAGNTSGAVNAWDGRLFKIRLCGTASLGAGQTIIFYLYNGAATVVGTSGNRVGSTGSAYPAATGSGAANFLLEFTGLWDATSQILSGSYTANIANATTSQFTLPTVITNVQTSVAAAGLTFCAGVKLGTTTATTISVREFVVERI